VVPRGHHARGDPAVEIERKCWSEARSAFGFEQAACANYPQQAAVLPGTRYACLVGWVFFLVVLTVLGTMHAFRNRKNQAVKPHSQNAVTNVVYLRPISTLKIDPQQFKPVKREFVGGLPIVEVIYRNWEPDYPGQPTTQEAHPYAFIWPEPGAPPIGTVAWDPRSPRAKSGQARVIITGHGTQYTGRLRRLATEQRPARKRRNKGCLPG
jgi:hypothetical protein